VQQFKNADFSELLRSIYTTEHRWNLRTLSENVTLPPSLYLRGHNRCRGRGVRQDCRGRQDMERGFDKPCHTFGSFRPLRRWQLPGSRSVLIGWRLTVRAQLDTAQAVIEQGGQDGAVTHAAHAAQGRWARPAARAPGSRQPPASRLREYVLATNNIEHIFCSKRHDRAILVPNLGLSRDRHRSQARW